MPRALHRDPRARPVWMAVAIGIASYGCGVDRLDVLGPGRPGDPVDGGIRDAGSPPPPEAAPYHVYRFTAGAGTTVFDRAGRGRPLDLVIDEPSLVTWLDGGLRLDGATLLRSAAPPADWLAAVVETDAVTIEAWVTPTEPEVTGTHRIVTVSDGASRRNVTLGQGDVNAAGPSGAWTVRLRTAESSPNGLPATTTEPAVVIPGALTHLVAVRDPTTEETVLHVDGAVAVSGGRGGDLDGFDPGFLLYLGNEVAVDDDARAFSGILHQVVLWARALSVDEVGARFAAGPD